MNAVVRPKHEVPVLTNDAIEVHLASLHAGQEELRKDVRELRADNKSIRDKIDTVQTTLSQDIKALDKKLDEKFETLDRKIGQNFETLDGKITAVDKKLDEKFDSLNTKIGSVDKSLRDKIDAVNANLGEKITRLSNDVAGMRGLQKATIWLIGILGSLGIAGKLLHWP